MSSSRFTQIQMLDWLRECVETDKPMPTDAEICDRFNLASPERARSLLVDLAERKEITLSGHGADRTITLGHERVVAPATPRPVPSVVKRDPEVEKAAAKIVSIIKREPAPVEEAAPIVVAAQEALPEAPATHAPSYIGTSDELAALIGKLVSELAARAGQTAEIEALKRERDAAVARAEAAEAKLATARQALAA